MENQPVPRIAPACDGMFLRRRRQISMYAVIRAGGKQYRVAPGDVIRVESQATRHRRQD